MAKTNLYGKEITFNSRIRTNDVYVYELVACGPCFGG